MGPKDDRPDGHGSDSSQKNSAGRYILGVANERVKLRRGYVCQKLKGCIQRFRAVHTIAIAKTIQHQSDGDMRNKNPALSTTSVAAA
jgi:hypothetical protein